MTWCASGLFAALVAARRLGVTSDADRSVMVAVALLAAAALALAGRGILAAGAARRRSRARRRGCRPGRSRWPWNRWRWRPGVVAAGSVVASLLGPHEPGRYAAVAAVGVLFGLALLAIGLIVRWGEEWLVYAAQGSLLGGYLYYRHAFPLPAAADAAVLTLFGYLDLGLAEVLHRVGLGRFARPTRYFSLALPVLPLALGLYRGGPRRVAAVRPVHARRRFTAIAGQTMRWRSLGYAAAVLYNAVPLAALGPDRLDARRPPAVLPGPGRALGDPLRRGRARVAGPAGGERDPGRRPVGDLPLAGLPRLAVREPRRRG